MHARKIALHRTSILAFVMTLLVIGSVLAFAGNSTAINPQVGTVNYTASYYLGGSVNGPANVTVDVSTLNGAHVTSVSGALNQVSLPYGSYIFSVSPAVVSSRSPSLISNGTSQIVNVSAPTQSVSLKLSSYEATTGTVTVTGIDSGSATIYLSTPSGFVFKTGSLNSTSYNLTTLLPHGDYYVKLVYGEQTFSYYETTYPSSGTLTLTLPSTPDFGYVTSVATGSPISNFKIVDLNLTSRTYTVLSFNGGFYQVNSLAGTYNNVYTLAANGYAPKNITGSTGQANFALNYASGNISYNYNLAPNPYYLNLTVNLNLDNSTTVPFLANSSVGSLYWQYRLDNLGSTTVFAKYLQNYLGMYTNYSIVVAGYNYNETGYGSIVSTTTSANGNSTTATVDYEYTNPSIKASDLSSGFQVKLFMAGTQYLPGALYSNYTLSYSVPGVSLASPVSAARTFVNPVHLVPQTSSGFVTLTFEKVSSPTVVASEINLFWNNTTPQNYLVASNSTSAVFLVPTNVPVSLNVSNGFYNPVTGTNDYQNSLYYNWTLSTNGGAATPIGHGYNLSHTFSTFANYTLTVNYTSASGVSNQTTFTVFAYNGTPAASLNVTSLGNTIFATGAVSGTQSLTVPQSKTVQFSAYYSKLNIPGTSYYAPLAYNWYFPGYANNAVNVSQTFDTPYVQSQALITGYLNVASTVGKVSNVTLSINVTDTTAPSATITLKNSTQATIAQPVAGEVAIFSANSTTDKYYAASQLSYSWSIVYANGTAVPNGSNTYELVNNNTNLPYFMVKFNTLNSLIVSLKVTNPSNVSAYKNFTTSMVVNSPRLIVQNAYFPSTPTQGATTLIYLNVSNNGTVDASSFSIVELVNGKNVSYQTYGALAVGVTKQVEFNLSAPTSGSVQFEFQALNGTQPSFFSSNGALTLTHTVNPPSYQTLIIIGVVIAIIVIIGVVYYRFSSRGSSSKAPAKPRDKKAVPAKKADEKKK